MRWEFLDHDGVLAFAHRGGDRVAPENTLGAFQHAVDLGYRYLETDVHVTADGELVAVHDDGLSRVAGRDVLIAEERLTDLCSIALVGPDGGAHHVPRLAELLETFPDARFSIDPKVDAAVAPLAKCLENLDAVNRVCVGSFSDDRVREMQDRLGPELCTVLGPGAVARTALPGVRSPLGYGIASLPRTFGPIPMFAAFIKRFSSQDLAVVVWTVNERDEMERFLDRGVDGLMTDDPETLKSVLQTRGQWAE